MLSFIRKAYRQLFELNNNNVVKLKGKRAINFNEFSSLFHLPNDNIFWNQSPTVRLLKPIYEKYRRSARVYGPEHMQEEWNFLEAILQTPIMSKTMQFLNSRTVLQSINDSNKDKKSKEHKSQGHSERPDVPKQSSTKPNSVTELESFGSSIKNFSKVFQNLNQSITRDFLNFENSFNHATRHPDSENKFDKLNHTISHQSTSHHAGNKTTQQLPNFNNNSNHLRLHPDSKTMFHKLNPTNSNPSRPPNLGNKTIERISNYKNSSNHATLIPDSKNKFNKLNHTISNRTISQNSENKTIQRFPNSRTNTFQPVLHPNSTKNFHKFNHTKPHHFTSNHHKNKTIHRIPNLTKKFGIHNSIRSNSRHNLFHKSKLMSNSKKWYSSLKPNVGDKPLLRSKKDVGSTRQQQIDFLRKIWFTDSSGNINMHGSGFEKAFMGALIAGTNITGFHNWIYFAEEERLGNLDYKGYVKYEPLGNKNQHFVAAVRLAFHNITSSQRTLFIGISPELEMSLYTACFVLNKKGKCSVDLGGKRIIVNVSKGFLQHNKQKYIAAAYPEIV